MQARPGLVPWLAERLNDLTRNRSLDRLIRSRTWIALIAFALIGIVTLQLLVLRLNANIGHALVRESQLQRENAALSIESSELAAGERVESQAAHLGMELVPEGSLRFLASTPASDVARAAAALKAPVHSSSTPPASSTSSSSTAASSADSSEAPSGEAAASTSAGSASEQTTAAAQEPASSASSATTGTAETQTAGTEAPPAEAAPSTSSSTAGATGAAEAAAGGVGANQTTPAG